MQGLLLEIFFRIQTIMWGGGGPCPLIPTVLSCRRAAITAATQPWVNHRLHYQRQPRVYHNKVARFSNTPPEIKYLHTLIRHSTVKLANKEPESNKKRAESSVLCFDKSKESPVCSIILRQFLVIFLTPTCISFTKLKIRWSF